MRFNIFSGSRDGNGLAAALTNPTTLSRRKGTVQQDYPVEYAGKVWPDAEHAFLMLQVEEEAYDDLIMVDIIAAKFKQHLRLAEAVQQRGGVNFLEKCEHFTGAKTPRFAAWEGYGRESRFIRNLIAGYEKWEQTQ